MGSIRNTVRFQSKWFNTTEAKPTFINPRCFGEDVGIWLASELEKRDVECRALIQEDWGWSLPVGIGKQAFYINFGITDEPKQPPEWLVSIERRGILSVVGLRSDQVQTAALRSYLDEILSTDPRVSGVEWSEE
jgi:hypothetical protein